MGPRTSGQGSLLALRLRWRLDGGAGLRRVDHGNHSLNRHRLPFGDFDFQQHARGGGGNFRVHLIGGNFKQRLVPFHSVAGFFQPLGDGALEDALAHLGHDHFHGHGVLLFSTCLQYRARSRAASATRSALGKK